MNGLGRPAPRRSARELREELALLEALEPIQDAHHAAKDAYRDAVASGGPVEAAKTARDEAAARLNSTRQWLRRERRIVRLKTLLATSTRVDDGWRAQAETEIADLEAAVADVRALKGGK